jgi:putative drug exporter of the RND superfamily
MGPLSRWAVRRPWSAVAVWLVIAVLIGGMAAKFGGSYNDSFELPDTESASAQEVLGQIPGVEDALTEATVKVVWSPESGSVTDPAIQEAATALLTGMSNNPSVTCVVTPYGAPLGGGCPDPATQPGDQAQGGSAGTGQSGSSTTAQPTQEQAKVLAGMGPAGMSVDGSVAYATVTFGAPVGEIPLADVSAVLEATQAANGVDGLTVGASGQALEAAAAEPPSSEGIGVTIALFILLFAFGSLIGALLPVGTALLSLGLGQALVLITANFFNVATFAPTLAAMIGLGVGIDYSLFVINRYRQALEAGREPREAVLESVRTAGRSVLFAAATVIIALSGLFVIGFEFFNGLAVASIGTVVMMMIGATFLLPAVLSLLGRRAFAVRMPWARKTKVHNPAGSGFARYGRWLQRRYKVVGGLALAVVVVLALPIGSMRLGFTDDGGRPEGSSARIAYDLLAEGFGPGLNGPFIVTAETAQPGDNAAVAQLAGALSADPGVAVAIPFPMAPDSSVTAVQVIPTTSPQAAETEELLVRIRGEVIPPVAQATGLTALVGGTLAITSDFTTVLTDALPLFLLVVIGFGFLALVLLFRSILVPLTGVVTSLLSLAAAMGVTVAVFQWGWLAELIGVTRTGPIMPFLPIMVFAILFGLSMDYQVFLVSRMQEEWGHTADNDKAVRRGLAASGRVVMIAAAIMISVFSAFVLGNEPTIKLFGLALATAVLFDAFVIRLIIVPSVMYQLGNANWWLPAWLGRVLPNVAVESEEDASFEAAEIDDIPDEAVPTPSGA